jgi:hypothetical protein
LLTVVEILDSLSSLERRVGVPDTTGLGCDLLDGVRIGRISWSDILHGTRLDTDDTDRDATKASTTDNDGLCPSAKSLDKRSAVEETRLEAILIFFASNEMSDIVCGLARRIERDVAIPVVSRR